MGRWFRIYDEALHDPKVQSLPPVLFKFWFNILCVASKNGGQIPSLDALKLVLTLRYDRLNGYLKDLITLGLIDVNEDGVMEPHNWKARQYQSDNSDPTAAERMRRYRERNRNNRNAVTAELQTRVQSTEYRKKESKKDYASPEFPSSKEPLPKRAAPPPSPATAQPSTVVEFPKKVPEDSEAKVSVKDPKAELYGTAKSVLGAGSGSLVAKALKVYADDVPRVARLLEAAAKTGEAKDAKAYFCGGIKRQQDRARQDELDAEQIANWRPTRGRYPNRDWGHPRQLFYLTSKVDGQKKLYLDTIKVEQLVQAQCEQLDIVQF